MFLPLLVIQRVKHGLATQVTDLTMQVVAVLAVPALSHHGIGTQFSFQCCLYLLGHLLSYTVVQLQPCLGRSEVR